MTDPKPPQPQSAQEWFQSLMEKWWGQLLVFAGGLALYLLLGLLLWWGLDLYINPQDSAQKKDLVQALALIMAGVAGVIGILLTWRGQWITQKAQEANQNSTNEQLKNAQNTLDITRQGQITERFTHAIDQLGDDKRVVRIGGIYALAKIAEDSDVYYWPIIEILAAYVRKNAPWPTTEASESRDDSDHEEELKAGKERSHQHKRLDIQAILYILRDLRDPKHHHDNGEDDFIRLTDTDLQDADLREIHLERARLRGANLKEARLGSAHLSEARLRNTKFVEANLEKANLQLADLEEAILCKAELQGANLQRADLEGAFLQGADLRKADLRKATLQKADLRKTNLQGALLEGALLEGADLQGADLQGAFLQGADLQGTRELTQKQIEWAIGSNEPLFQTKLPEGLSRPQLWSKSIEEQTKIVPKNS